MGHHRATVQICGGRRRGREIVRWCWRCLRKGVDTYIFNGTATASEKEQHKDGHKDGSMRPDTSEVRRASWSPMAGAGRGSKNEDVEAR